MSALGQARTLPKQWSGTARLTTVLQSPITCLSARTSSKMSGNFCRPILQSMSLAMTSWIYFLTMDTVTEYMHLMKSVEVNPVRKATQKRLKQQVSLLGLIVIPIK